MSALYVPNLDPVSREELVLTDDGFEVSGSARTNVDDGFGFVAAIGYEAREGARFELELGRRSVEGRSEGEFQFESTNGIVGRGTVAGRGTLVTWSLMANGLWAPEQGRLRPYVGGGAGLVRQEFVFHGGVSEGNVEGNVYREQLGRDSDMDVVFGYQALAGVGIALTGTLEARFGYRFFATAKADFEDTGHRYRTHNLEAGLLFRF